MSTLVAREFEQGTMVYLGLLDKVEEQRPPFFDPARVRRVKKEIKRLRLDALAAEVSAEYPNIEIDYELLELVGIDDDIPVKDEKMRLANILEERHGYADAD